MRKPENENVNFSVHYKDRFVGIVDIPIDKFIESGIPGHRVMLIKRDGEIVWDRKN